MIDFSNSSVTINRKKIAMSSTKSLLWKGNDQQSNGAISNALLPNSDLCV